jgi:formyltetrahydrofolate deformylase
VASYVVTLQCIDGPGIVLAASSAIVELGGNILENDQFSDPVTNEFCMRTRFETEIEDAGRVENSLATALSRFAPHLRVRPESVRRRALIMVSKFDHCLADLLYRHDQGDLVLDIVAIVSNHGDCADLAQRHGVPYYEIAVSPSTRAGAETQLLELVEQYRADFVVLARYMQVLSPELCAKLSGRVVNIHHSFLPGFKGAKPYHQAYERGVKLIGATAHFVTNDLDEGPIIEQGVVRVSHARQPSELVALGRDIERDVLSRAVQLVSEDRVALVGQRTVVFSQ